MLIGFRYLPPVTETDRYNPTIRGAELQFVAAWGSEDGIVLADPGVYCIYKESDDKVNKDGAPKSFTFLKWIGAEKPEVPEVTLTEAKTLAKLPVNP